MVSTPGSCGGRPDTTEPNTTSSCPVSSRRVSAQAPWRTVLSVSPSARAAPSSAAARSSVSSTVCHRGRTDARPVPGATSVGSSSPASACRQACSEAARSCAASHAR